MTKANEDWTVNPATGRCNSSEQFEKLTIEVARLIRGSAHDLIAGNAGSVAHLIMAQLAHVHGMRPSETEITCLADIERLVAEDVKQSGKPGPRIVTIGTHTRQILEALSLGRGFAGGTLDLPSGQTIIIRLHHAEQYLSIERVPEEKEEITHSASTTRCWFCKITDVTEKLTITSKSYGWSALGNERAHDTCANAWRELTAGNRTDLLCAVLCDFYYSTEGMTNLEHYADQLCETLLQLSLIHKHQAGQWSAFYITDLGKAFFKKVLVAPWYKAVTLKVQVDRLALYAVSAGLTPHWLYLGRKQQQELDAWIPASTSRGPVSKFHTSGGVIEVIRLRATDELSLHGYTQTQPGVKEYSEAITLETVANQK